MTWLAAALIALPSAMWLFGLLLWRARADNPVAGATAIQAGVVVVARNEAPTIETCLRAILDQKPPIVRVMLLDDGSTDETVSLAQGLAARDARLEIQAMQQSPRPRSPKKEALATGFRELGTPQVLCTDADCVVPPTWSGAMIKGRPDDVGAVIGASFPPAPATTAERVYRWERLVANALMASACGWGKPASACGHSILYCAEALKAVDAPVRRDLPSGDDDLTVQAISRAGWRVQFCDSPDSVVADLGGLRGSRWDQAARHQSVVRYYPWYWRLLFAATIVASLAAIVVLLGLPVMQSRVVMAGVALKFLLDFATGAVIASRLRLNITVVEIILASLLLPIWTVWRAASGLMGRASSWRGRSSVTQIA